MKSTHLSFKKAVFTLAFLVVCLAAQAQTTPLKWHDFKTYKPFTPKKIVCHSLALVAGVAHGVGEAFHAEPTIFETRWGVSDRSFWGSEQWARQYYPSGKHRPDAWNFTRDAHHMQNAVKKPIWIGCSFALALGRQPPKYKILDLIISTAISTAATATTYAIVRKEPLFVF